MVLFRFMGTRIQSSFKRYTTRVKQEALQGECDATSHAVPVPTGTTAAILLEAYDPN